ncbi:MAG TPA: GMC family oxidoreductase [Micromonosporaceae bacterium]|nr:GMC family oxidoreductase [Micromonosporaceae bacterium]
MGRNSAQAGSEYVDTIVVGSGFGGSVAAYRLAEGGQSVVVLERGRPYPPGSFARTPEEMRRNFWDPSEGRYGLFDVWRFRGFDSVVASGLGGGSLIYANVLLRKDERWFVREEPMPGGGYERWPIGRADLDPFYDSVERMLGANPYPLRLPAYQDTPKTHAMITAAEQNGLPWQLPPLAISFAANAASDPALGVPITTPVYGNVHGVQRRTCTLTGECNIGCNLGAKNTLDHTYLSAAQYHGADIRTRCEVRGIRPLETGGYEVRYVRHDPEETPHPHDTANLPTHRLVCRRLILGAGAYGTPYLLMRNAATLPGVGPCLGTRFSGNGDLLTFLRPRRGESGARRFDGSRGPVTTSTIRVSDALDGGAGRGFYVSDGGYPGFVDWLAESRDVTSTAFRFGEAMVRWAMERVTRSPQAHFSTEVSRLLSDGTLTAGSLPLLGVGRDVPDGVMRLRDGDLDVSWTSRTSATYLDRVRETMKQLAESLDAEHIDNAVGFFRRIVTVHPVGGAPMGRDETEGVCDSYGEVFNHGGLYIADGSALPGPVGANPALTIAAHADRMATHILETLPAKRGAAPTGSAARGASGSAARGASGSAARVASGSAARVASGRAATARLAKTPGGPPAGSPLATPGTVVSLEFTEEMKGFFAFGTDDSAAGERLGKVSDQPLMFHLEITAHDVDRFLSDPAHLAGAQGWISSDALGGRLPVQHGSFNLFVPGASAETRRMSYRLFFADAAGNPLTLSGRKEVRDDSILDVWLDASTLFYRILAGHVAEADEPQATVRGAGVAHIHPSDFAQQLTTFRAAGPGGADALARFGRFFMGQLWDVYGTQPPARTAAPRASASRRR